MAAINFNTRTMTDTETGVQYLVIYHQTIVTTRFNGYVEIDEEEYSVQSEPVQRLELDFSVEPRYHPDSTLRVVGSL